MGRRGGVHRASGRPTTPPLRPLRAAGGSLVPQLPLPRVEARSFRGPCATDSAPPFRCPLVGATRPSPSPVLACAHLAEASRPHASLHGPAPSPRAAVSVVRAAQSPARACGRPRSGSLSERPGGHLHRA